MSLSDEEIQEAYEGIRQVLHRLNPPTPEPKKLFHYTTESGLKAILSNQTLRATHLKDMKDPSELVHAEAIVQQQIDSDPTLLEEDLAAFFRKRKGNFNPYSESIAAFATCFSTEADDPGQWIRYGDAGRGYALEFDPRPLVFGLSASAPRDVFVLLEAAVYDLEKQEGSIKAVVRTVAAKYHELLRRSDIAILDRRTDGFLSSELAPLIARFKNATYRDEREYRIICSTSSKNALIEETSRAAKTWRFLTLKPYLPRTDMLPIVGIKRGPKLSADHADNVVRTAARVSGFQPPRTVASAATIP